MRMTILVICFTCWTALIYGQVFKQIDSLLITHQSRGFNGNVLYSKADTIQFTGNYGYSNLETKVPLNDSTLFELASCSKQFTALAILQLIEKEEIMYSSEVNSIIENFPYSGITIEHLLRHQSGLPDYMILLNKRRFWNRKNIATNKDVLELFKKIKPKLDFSPGTNYEYSNTGYLLLASIIEQLSGKSYEEYLAFNLFEPANMTQTRVYRRRYRPEKIENISEGFVFKKRKKRYISVDKDKQQKYIYWLDGIVGDGMINSTILDLEKWKQAIRYNKLISQESKHKMFIPDRLSTDYGYGFSIIEKESIKKIYHTGSWAGYYTFNYYRPNTNEYIVILCNNEYAGFVEILNDLLSL